MNIRYKETTKSKNIAPKNKRAVFKTASINLFKKAPPKQISLIFWAEIFKNILYYYIKSDKSQEKSKNFLKN